MSRGEPAPEREETGLTHQKTPLEQQAPALGFQPWDPEKITYDTWEPIEVTP